MGSITRADVGAWVVKANPQMWDVHAAIGRDESLPGYRLYPSYRIDLVEPGDRVLIWATQDRARKLPAGFVGEAIVDGLPENGRGTGDLWRDRSEKVKIRPYLGLRETVWWDQPVDVGACRADPVLSGLEVIRVPQLGNPNYATPEQVAALDLR